MNKRIGIVIGSPVDYEELTADVVIDGKFVVLVNQEADKDNLKIEFYDNPDVKEVGFDIFIEALNEAKATLIGR